MVPAKIRRRAEARLRATKRDVAAMPVKDVQQLVYELQVHQIELEMQNEELRRAQELQAHQIELEMQNEELRRTQVAAAKSASRARTRARRTKRRRLLVRSSKSQCRP